MSTLQVLYAEVKDELEKMKKLIIEAEEIEQKNASNVSIRTGGSILHDFYTGAEKIFEMVANTIDKRVPSGMKWHAELLNQMTLNIPGLRSPIISKDTAMMLEEYLRFRHLFRKIYGFDLKWTNIKKLLKNMPAAYTALEKEIDEAFKESK
jgi:hypothetical protein